MRSNPHGTTSRIHSLRLRQRLLKLELRDAKRRLMIPDTRWDYNRKYQLLHIIGAPNETFHVNIVKFAALHYILIDPKYFVCQYNYITIFNNFTQYLRFSSLKSGGE